MKRLLLAILVLATLAIPTISSATPPREGPYFSGFIGMAFPSDVDSTGFDLNDRVEFDPGFNIGGTAGFDFGVMRMEAELSYKEREISRVTDRISGVRYRGVDGSLEATALMGNLFFDLHNQSPVTPYFGGGVGFATLHQSDIFGTDSGTGSRVELYQSDDDAVLAYQAGAGLEIAMNRQLSLDLGYRYFRTTRASFNSDTLFDNEMRFESHNASIGFRVKF